MSLGFFWENKTRKDVIVELFGTVVVYIIMACAVAGAIASAIKPESELGQQFVAGVDSIGPIFLPVAGIMARRRI